MGTESDNDGPCRATATINPETKARPKGQSSIGAEVRSPVAEALANAAAEPLGIRILLAEDGPDNQRLVSFVLRKAGADVTVVSNGWLAVEKALRAQDEGSPFEVILMDMQMPGMDGYTAASRLRSHGIGVPIIALTAHAMSGDREKCLAAGCSDYLTKPVNRAKLLEMIRKELRAQ